MEIVKYYKQKHFYDNKEKVAITSSNNLYNHNHTIDLLYRTLGIGTMADTNIESLPNVSVKPLNLFMEI